MTKECYYCGFRDPMPFSCKFCGNSYCYNHRLPESHNCPGLLEYKSRGGGIFNNRDSVVRRKYNPFLNSLNNIVSAIKSNYSLTIPFLAILSFFVQNIVPGYSFYLALSPHNIFSRPWTLVTH